MNRHENLDLFESKKLRDEALDRVSDRSKYFMENGFAAIKSLPPGEYTGENIRVILSDRDIVPHHQNAWGALIMSAVRHNILENTGRMQSMRTPKSHARKTFVYLKRDGS